MKSALPAVNGWRLLRALRGGPAPRTAANIGIGIGYPGVGKELNKREAASMAERANPFGDLTDFEPAKPKATCPNPTAKAIIVTTQQPAPSFLKYLSAQLLKCYPNANYLGNSMQNHIAPEQLAAEFDAIIRSLPNRKTLHHDRPENHEWLGQAAALVALADPVRGIFFRNEIAKLHDILTQPGAAAQSIIITLQQFKTEWRLKEGGPLNVAFEAGRPFDYFDEVRKIIEGATSDVFVVDPYLGAEFISRYLPHVKTGVTVRLLIQNQVTQVKPAVELFSDQSGAVIEIRKSKDMHDRFIFIDRRECYHSGATFKDGAVKSATILTQITDAFAVVMQTYEESWANGTT